MALSNMSVLDNEMIDESLFASVGIEPLEASSILPEQEFMELEAEDPSKNINSINSLETSLDYLLEDHNDTMCEDNLSIEHTETSSPFSQADILEPNKSPEKSDVLSRVTSIAFGDDCEEDVYIPSIGILNQIFPIPMNVFTNFHHFLEYIQLRFVFILTQIVMPL